MPRTPRLKVYAAAAGFSEAIVAAPSQKAALEAWGAREDYFAHGIARIVDDPETIEAALAQPGVILKRPVGSAEAFVAAAKPPAKTPAEPRTSPADAKPRPKPKPDRSALDAAEAALTGAEDEAQDLNREQRKALDAFRQRQAEARDKAAAAVDERKKARDAARAAYRKAAG